MSNGDLWLGFDVGTTGTKAALLSPDGQILQTAYRAYPTVTAEGGFMEQDAADWWQSVLETSRELAQQVDTQYVAAIALTGQMQDLIMVNGEGNAVRPVILYGDTRARAESETIVAKLGAERLYELTGNEQDASSLLAKLLWLSSHERGTLNTPNGQLLLGAADFIALKMTGKAVTDTTTAATTGLMDIASRTALDRRVFDQLGIGNALRLLLPPMQSGGSFVGELTQIAAGALGLKSGIPVYHGPGDAGAITIGVGAGEIGQAYGYLGTSGWIAYTSSDPTNREGGFLLAHPHPDYFIHVAPLLTAGGNLEWVLDLFGDDHYDHLIDQGYNRPPSSLLYLPYLNGERSPFRDPLARGAFVGLTPRTEKADMYRAALEGVAYAYRHAFEALLDSPVDRLTFTGGGTRSTQWCQLFADILNVPIDIAAEPEFIGVRGAMIAAAVANGQLDSYSPPGLFPISQTLEPHHDERQHYDRQYRLFRELYPALRPIFAGMA
jgi:xylulokinase